MVTQVEEETSSICGTCVRKSTSLSQMIPVHRFVSYSLKIHDNIILQFTPTLLIRCPGFNSWCSIIFVLHSVNGSGNCKFSSPCTGQPDSAVCTAVRAVELTSYMTSLVLFAGYSAYLVSSQTVQHTVLPFRSLQGLLDDGSYGLGLAQNSSHLNLFDVIKQ